MDICYFSCLWQQESSCEYWPTAVDKPVHYGKLIVTLKSEKQDKEFTIRKFEITEDKVWELWDDDLYPNIHTCTHTHLQTQSAFGNDKAVASFAVTQFHFTEWEEQGRPGDCSGILQMAESVNAVQRSTGNKPITVLCKWVGETVSWDWVWTSTWLILAFT